MHEPPQRIAADGAEVGLVQRIQHGWCDLHRACILAGRFAFHRIVCLIHRPHDARLPAFLRGLVGWSVVSRQRNIDDELRSMGKTVASLSLLHAAKTIAIGHHLNR